ncbi:MAG: hypothetical protein AAB019_05835 [Planctomycetota bacterium]
MGKIGGKELMSNNRKIKQIILQRSNDIKYFKSVPQTDVPMYALNLKEDGSDAHIYNYNPGGSERLINGKKNPIWLNSNQLLSKELKPNEPWDIALLANTATCVVTAISSDNTYEITAEQKENTKIITVSSSATSNVFVAFLNKNDKPISF